MATQMIQTDILGTGVLPAMISDYLQGHPQLKGYYSWIPAHHQLPELIEARKNKAVDRNVLVDALIDQHKQYFDRYANLESQIRKLGNDNTFTVTTGHQLCLATGPLYFIYKIVSTIRLAQEWSKLQPDCHFVPVYWMATEDHDFEEIKSIHVFQKKVSWENEAKGATGRLSTASIEQFIGDLQEVIGLDQEAQKIIALLRDAYVAHDNLAEATRYLVLHLFAQYGLLVLDADRPELKKQFVPVLKEELLSQSAQAILQQSDEQLSKHYKLQVNARALNIFYLDDQLRERIVHAPDGHYEVVNTDLGFSPAFLMDLLQHQPERFSPNVVLRPLYQEAILPNLAYIGGPGEISYWLQLKSLFDHHGIFYPMLVPRNHALMIKKREMDKFLAMGFAVHDLFSSEQNLIMGYLSRLTDTDTSLDAERSALRTIYLQLVQRLVDIDSTLQSTVQAEMQKTLNGMDNLEKKLVAAVKRNNESALSFLTSIHNKVYPNKQLQERELNFIPYYLRMNTEWIESLMQSFDPLTSQMTILVEQD